MFAFADFATAPDQSIQQLLINQKKAQFAVHHKAVDGTASAAQTVQASGTPAMDAVTANVCVIFGPPKWYVAGLYPSPSVGLTARVLCGVLCSGKTSLLFHAAYEHAKAGGHPLLILTVKAPPPLPADSISAEIKLQESKPHLPRYTALPALPPPAFPCVLAFGCFSSSPGADGVLIVCHIMHGMM